MRKLSYFTIVALAISLVSVSCSKKEELNPIDQLDEGTMDGEFLSDSRETDPRWKFPLLTDVPEGEDPCVQGLTNCLSYCCVTPRVVSDFLGAIDAGEEKAFLSDSEILDEIGQGFKYYVQLLNDVRDGNKAVTYYEYQDGKRVMILYGPLDVSLSKFEAAQALSR